MIEVLIEDGGICPTKAHKDDAGWDLYAPHDCILCANSKIVLDTKIHMLVPKGYAGIISSRSGMNTRFGVVSQGVVDSGYIGSIKVCLINSGCDDVMIYKGDRIAQIVLTKICTDNELEEIIDLPFTDREAHGFGSTGR